MSTVLRTIEFLSLSLWLGSDAFFSFVVAPGAFSVLASRDQAGAMVGYALWRMHFAGVVCGVVFLLARLVRSHLLRAQPGMAVPPSAFASLVAPAALCVVLMIALTVISQHAVSPRMAELRGKMGSIQATAEGDPLLAEFGKLHRMSVMLEGGVLLAGVAAMFFMVREMGRV
jgi:uncharacterized membrane protein